MSELKQRMREVGLVDVQDLDSTIQVHLAYATPNNFMNQIMYESHHAFLLESVAKALVKAQNEFKSLGYAIKILDAYRPFSVQEKFWERYPKPSFLARPLRNEEKLVSGSKHNRGAAVDITLVDKAGAELPMPTPFDEFSARAGRSFIGVNDPELRNVKLLEEVMQKYHFLGLPSEWWHFDHNDWTEYPLLDVPL
tara:strand:+ start:101086 stop:101670 length:585 start_codon:yes stop_codon:yes gene_type:complete